MSLYKVKLTRNLRRSLLQGHPWVYREAIAQGAAAPNRAQLVKVLDQKNEHLGWAIFDPHSPLALRFICTADAPPTAAFFERRLARAFALRQPLRADLREEYRTNAYRLFNGEGDLLPGLVCDIYNRVAVLQFDGDGPREF